MVLSIGIVIRLCGCIWVIMVMVISKMSISIWRKIFFWKIN